MEDENDFFLKFFIATVVTVSVIFFVILGYNLRSPYENCKIEIVENK